MNDGLTQQLDLFEHSPLNVALHEFGQALLRRDLVAGERCLVQLRNQSQVTGTLLSDCAELLRAASDSSVLLRDPERGLQYLRERLAPLARRWLGGSARLHEQHLLTRIAQAMDVRGFVNGRDHVHPAELWLELGQTEQAQRSVNADLFWRGCPLRLVLQARIAERLGDALLTLDAWVRLCLIDPPRAEWALPRSVLLQTPWGDFSDLDPELETCWFPLWLELTRLPLPRFRDLPEVGAPAQLLLLAQHTQPSERDSAGFRRAVQQVCPPLLKHCLGRWRS
jgi:hypothetical protein